MKAGRFFSMAYDIRHNPKIELLRDDQGGMVAFGRWVALMGILYDVGGVYEIETKAKRRYLVRELEFADDAELTVFLNACAECELIDPAMLEAGRIASAGICDQLEYYRQKSEAGKKGNEKRWGKRKNRTSESH